VRSRPSTLCALLTVPTGVLIALAAATIGCGDSSGSVKTESQPDGRFKGLRSLSESNSKEVIAENKKKALAALKEKPVSSPVAGKP
jgi:hypothetical protein